MATNDGEEAGKKLISAVERLLAADATLLREVELARARTKRPAGATDEAFLKAVGADLVGTYSTRCAISGGMTAAPALVPGLGTAVALGGVLADMALMMKFEVELALCLSHLFGYDIRQERERQLAFLLVGIGTYETKAGGNVLVDLAQAEGTAIWNYGTRELSKVLVAVMGKVALLAVGKSLVRVIPFVGIAVGAGLNKTLTKRVGEKCLGELALRRLADRAADAEGPAVAARLRPDDAGENR